jgi:hypothetical protein
MSGKVFIKSADTKSPVANSRGEIEKMLRRYGATGLSVSQDYAEGRITIAFVVPNTTEKDAPTIPVRLQASVRDVYDRLYGRPQLWRTVPGEDRPRWVHNPKGYLEKQMQQAERVAWRHLVLWIDAALTAAQAGLQTISEAFFAHIVIPTETGEALRMVDYLDRVQASLAPGVRALLAAPAEEERR